jgi:ribonuclease III
VGHLLMQQYPDCQEGDLTQMRSNLVNENRLAAIARQIRLGENLLLGRGEERSGGRNKSSILADALEALFAAIYLDGGFNAAFDAVHVLFETVLGAASFDPKSELQELSQKKFQITPTYELLSETGPDHDKVFTVELKLAQIQVKGSGKSKKQAEKMAALRALSQLSK